MLEQLTFSQCVEDFIIERKSRGRTKRTLQLYKSELSYFSHWLQENNYPSTIKSITPTMLREWFASLAEHRNQGGVHSNYRIMKALLNWFDFEFEPEWKNPIRKVRIEPHRIPPLEEIPIEDVQKLLDVCYGRNELRDRCILKVLVDTGARATEILSLNIGDIDMKDGSVKIQHGKGNKFRIVWLGSSALKAVKDYLATRENIKPEMPLILTNVSRRMKFFGLRALLKRLCNRAKIQDYSPHSFRRCFGLTLYRKTHDIFLVSKLLGHSQISVTLRYLNIGNSDLKEAHAVASPADLLD